MHEEERTIGSDSSGQNSIWKGWMWVSLLAKSITLSSTWIISGLGKTSLSSNIWTNGAPWVHQAIAYCRHVLGGLHKDLLGKLKNMGCAEKRVQNQAVCTIVSDWWRCQLHRHLSTSGQVSLAQRGLSAWAPPLRFSLKYFSKLDRPLFI